MDYLLPKLHSAAGGTIIYFKGEKLMIRAIRGAVTVERNERSAVFESVRTLMEEIIRKNSLDIESMTDIIFTLTPDITCAFPAAAVREMGITDVPLLDMAAPDIDGALKLCIRVMVHIETELKNSELRHVYLGGAAALRPDFAAK